MSKKWPGGIITPTPATPSGPYQDSTASGIWTIPQADYWIKQSLWPIAGRLQPDPQFNYVTMLLHGDGTNGAQNNTFLDGSTNNFTMTRVGNVTQGSFSPYGSNWSNYFDGSSYLTTATSASAFSFGTGDFTIEFWINSMQTTRCDPTGQDNTFTSSGWWGFVFNRSANNTMEWFENTNSRISATSVTWNNGQWNHVAVTRSGSSVKMFLNGTQVGSTYTTSFTYGASSVGVIAGVLSDDKISGPLTGYLSNFRIVKGTALYTGTFTPSTTPLTAVSGTSLLTCQANRFFDASTNALTITSTGAPSVQRFNPFGTSTVYSSSVIGGSSYYDGASNLKAPNNAALKFGTNDFTIEFWLYFTNGEDVTGTFDGGTSSQCYQIYVNGNEVRIRLYGAGGTIWNYGSMGSVRYNTWNHIALSRSGTTFRTFVNGVAGQTTTSSDSMKDYTGNIQIGKSQSYFYGYISDYRIVNGTALYTAAFTPPTAPLTAVTNTALLNNYTNGAIFNSAMTNNLDTVGNAQISTSVVKYGTGSLYFDGSGDWLQCANSPVNLLGSGSFTVECWVYLLQDNNTICAKDFGLANGFLIWTQSGQARIRTYNSGAGATTIATGAVLSQSTWTHLAFVRSGSAVTIYVNGVSQATGTSADDLSSTGIFTIGAYDSGTLPMYGYIDELRITKGYARYTTTFTPPTAAFPSLGPTS